MELGSAHDAIVQVAKSGVLLALEHNMLPKPILQEALRCVDVLHVVACHNGLYCLCWSAMGNLQAHPDGPGIL